MYIAGSLRALLEAGCLIPGRLLVHADYRVEIHTDEAVGYLVRMNPSAPFLYQARTFDEVVFLVGEPFASSPRWYVHAFVL
jgi:hypothetical protein